LTPVSLYSHRIISSPFVFFLFLAVFFFDSTNTLFTA
jgi:hypothetical protein